MDRVVRDKANPVNQRLSVNETAIRSLRQRARCGAVRTASGPQFFVPNVYNVYSVMVTINVPSGRWLVDAQATAVLNGDTAANEQIVMSAFSYDAETGEFHDEWLDNPSAFAWFPPAPGGSAQTMHAMCDLVSPERAVQISLACADVSNQPFYMLEPRLRLLPV